MAELVNRRTRARILLDAADLGLGTCRGVAAVGLGSLQSGFEDDLLALVGPAIEAAVVFELAMFWAMTSRRVRSASNAAVVLGRLGMNWIIRMLSTTAGDGQAQLQQRRADQLRFDGMLQAVLAHSTSSCSRFTVLPSRLTGSAWGSTASCGRSEPSRPASLLARALCNSARK